jgi:putative two-component system response regulator
LDNAEVIVRIRNMIETRLLHRQVLEHNRILEARVLERTEEVRAAHLEVVQRLAHTAERRDPDTGAHIIRMSRTSAGLAAVHGWPPEEVELLLHASALHDIGKIAIPDAILLKRGPLTDEEWHIMRSHAGIGADLLTGGSSRLMQVAHGVARWHHERWDGSGYPDGLAGEAIPLAARLCAVCDVFDAMTSDRCYHRAAPIEEGIRIIRAGRGTQFDPAVVDSFERALPRLLAIRSEGMTG